MRKKNWAALLCSILILASIGLGVSIIYSDYYFSPVSGLQSFTVADVSRTYLHPEEDTGTPRPAPGAPAAAHRTAPVRPLSAAGGGRS